MTVTPIDTHLPRGLPFGAGRSLSCISAKITHSCRNPRPGWDKGPAVAKALVGYVRGPDPRIVSDMSRLRRRIRELEAALARIRQEKDVLSAETDRHPESGGR